MYKGTCLYVSCPNNYREHLSLSYGLCQFRSFIMLRVETAPGSSDGRVPANILIQYIFVVVEIIWLFVHNLYKYSRNIKTLPYAEVYLRYLCANCDIKNY